MKLGSLIWIFACWLGVGLATPCSAYIPDDAQGGSAPAERQQLTTSFNVQDGQIVVPFPAGFCAPPPSYSEKIELAAKSLAQMNVHFGAMIVSCKDIVQPSREPIAIMVGSVNRAPLKESRLSYLRKLTDYFESKQAQLTNQLGQNNAKDIIEKNTGSKIDINGQYGFMDADDNAVYILANMQMSVDKNRKSGQIIEAMTTFNGYVVVYLVVAGPGSREDASYLLSVVKVDVAQLVTANENLMG